MAEDTRDIINYHDLNCFLVIDLDRGVGLWRLSEGGPLPFDIIKSILLTHARWLRGEWVEVYMTATEGGMELLRGYWMDFEEKLVTGLKGVSSIEVRLDKGVPVPKPLPGENFLKGRPHDWVPDPLRGPYEPLTRYNRKEVV